MGITFRHTPVVPTRPIGVGSLLLDVENPRHGRVQSQRDAILALVKEQGMKLVKIAEHIAANGLSPIESLLVTKSGSTYIVQEGNRRLAAVRLLNNPDIAVGTKYEKDYARIAKTAKEIPTEIECHVAASKEEAAPWVELRHSGPAEGVGTIGWGTEQKNRFFNKPGSQAGKAIAFIDTVAGAYPKNEALLANLNTILTDRLTTLGRLVADPEFRRRLALVEKDGRFLSHFPGEILEDAIEQLASDFATRMSVSEIKSKGLRTKYISKLPMPDDDARLTDAQPLELGSAPRPLKKVVRRTLPVRPGPIFKDLAFKRMGARITNILAELKSMDLDRYPNAAVILCRALLELSVDRVHDRKKWPIGNAELKTRVQKCLNAIDPGQKDPLYQAVRSGLADGTSMYAVKTLQGFVHNEHMHPSASEVRTFAANYGPFLAAIDLLV